MPPGARPKARLPHPRSAAASKLTEADLGVRVSIQFKIHDDDPAYPFSEVVGVLEEIDSSDGDAIYRILRRNGEMVEVKDTDIVRLKRIT